MCQLKNELKGSPRARLPKSRSYQTTVCAFVCVCEHVCVCMCAAAGVRMSTCVFAHVCVPVCVCVCVHISESVCEWLNLNMAPF